MRIDELKHGLHDEVDRVAPADATSGRRATDRRVRRHQRRQAMTAVGVGIVVILAVTAILRQGPTDELPVLVGPGIPDAPHLTAGYVPNGISLQRVIELPAQGPDIGYVPASTRTRLYAAGADAIDDAFAVTVNRYPPDRVRAIAPNTTASETSGAGSTSAPLPQTSTVRLGDGLVTTVRGDGKVSTIAVTSRSLTDVDRVALNHSVVLAADGETIERVDVPAGYHLVAESGSFGVLDFQGLVVSLGTEGAIAVYDKSAPGSTAGSTSKRFALGQVRDDQDSLDAFRWYLSQDRTLKVRGHDAIIGSYVSGSSMSARTTSSSSSSDGSSSSGSSSSDGSSGTTPAAKEIFGLVVAWFESDGNLVVIQADQIDEVELLRIAEGLQPLSDDEWRQFADTHSTTTLPANCTATPDGGSVCHSSGSAIAVPVPVSPGSTPGNR